jgi:CheY-like chemotaxis protein
MTNPDSLRTAILVVEDDVDIAAILRDLLEDEGYSVLHAHDGVAALDLLTTHSKRIGLILLDILMPRMNGRDFRRQQLRDPLIANIPVAIVTTGAEVNPDMLPAAFLRKPFGAEELLSLVERFIGPPTPPG